MTFLRAIANRFYNPSFYHEELSDDSLGSAFKMLVLVLATIWLLILAVIYVSLMPWRTMVFVEKMQNAYPHDLVVTVAQGEASINQPEPYAIANPFIDMAKDMPRNLVVFDTLTEFDPASVASSSAFVVVKKNFFVTTDNQGPRVSTFSKDQATTTINRKMIDDFVGEVRPYVLPVAVGGGLVVALFLALICTLAVSLYYMLFALILASVLLFLSIIRKTGFSYRQCYKATLLAIVPVILVSGLLLVLGIPQPPFLFSFLVILIAYMNTSMWGEGTNENTQ